MRKSQQRQILEMASTLGEAHTEIKRLLARGETASAVNLLADCQDAALKIGETTEYLVGDGTRTVAALEEYCELLYHTSVDVQNEAANISLKALQKQLVKIESTVKSELVPDKLEVVFLPYKASMWDAMDSVWRAARADDACDVHVVPIPYYDKLPDGSLGTEHCETEGYPPDLIFTDWRQYNIEERRPDIVFVHNPYDDANYVTSVHPDFYCKRLKDLADLLVYLPYFVCVDDVKPELCITPGTLYADKVVVQSEKVRGTYIREFRKFEKTHNCKGRYGSAESKFVALGSPKYDMALRIQRESPEPPAAWKRLMEKPDGTKKTVVLYNTTVDGLLHGNETALTKLRDVFARLQTREDSVLLWRPHPLNAQTCRSMRPQLLAAYQDIVAEFKAQGFGIYDDTPDLHRSIALSDAYLGDCSSLVALYQCEGKPVMIQDASITAADYDNRAVFARCFDDGDNLWFTDDTTNALLKMDKTTWAPEYMGSFPQENPRLPLARAIAENGGRLYFAPFGMDGIAEYSMAGGTFAMFPLGASQESPGMAYVGAVAWKEYVFFTPYKAGDILRFNTKTKELHRCAGWLAPLRELVTDDADAFFLYPLRADENTLLLAACGANAVLEFHMDTMEATVHAVGKKGVGYNGICFDGKNYWLGPRHDGPLVKWHPGQGVLAEFRLLPEGETCRYAFLPPVLCGGRLWLLPNLAAGGVKIDIDDETVHDATEFTPPAADEKTAIPNAYYFVQSVEERIYAYAGATKSLVELDCANGRRREAPVCYPAQAMAHIPSPYEHAFFKDAAQMRTVFDCLFYESPFERLEDYLSYLARRSGAPAALAARDRELEIFRNENVHADGTSGAAIYAACKQAVVGKGGAG